MPKKSFLPQAPQKGFAHLILVATGLLVFTVAAASVIPTTQEFPVYVNDQSVLGEDEEFSQEEKKIEEQQKETERRDKEEMKRQDQEIKEGAKRAEEIRKEEFKKIKEFEKGEKQKMLEFQKSSRFSSPPNWVKEKMRSASGSGKSETEVETEEGKIKTKVEDDGRVKFEIEKGKLKIKFKNGRLKIEREHEGTDEADFDKQELEDDIDELEDEIEQELEDDGIEIASSSGGLIIKKNKIRARTSFPLSVNPETNELVVTTPSGVKTVTILPDRAVENMLAKGVLSEVDKEESEDSVEIETKKDELVYKIKGEKDHKFLGFIPLKTVITAFVSAQTGQLTAQEQSLLSQIISRLSF